MPAIFGPRSDTILRILLVAAVGVPSVGLAGLMLLARSPLSTEQFTAVEQPIQFDHRHHVSDDGIDCRYCHDTVEKGPSAGIPDSAKCMNCHAQIWTRADLLEPVRRSFFDDTPIRWNRVHRLPDHVYFNHAIHVNKGVGCATCHGRVDQMPLISRAAPLLMQWCLDCHRNPAPNLRPKEQITSMTWAPQGDVAALGTKLMRDYDVHTRTSCTTCHR